MINVASIQNAYNKLYTQARKYIWGYPEVESLAELEIAAYTACPDMAQLHKRFNDFKAKTREVAVEDKEFQDALDAFEAIIKDDPSYYIKLYQVSEVLK